MSFYSINAFQSPSFFAFQASSEFLSDNELDQILNQPYEDAAPEITILPSIPDSSMTDDPQDFGPPPKLPLLPQFARIESLKTKETKKRKKEDEVLPAKVSADPTTKKKKPEPTNLTDRNIEPLSHFDNRLIKAIHKVVIGHDSIKETFKKYRVSESTLVKYVKNTNNLLQSPIQNEKTYEFTRPEIVNAAVARCQISLKADPSLKIKDEHTRLIRALKEETVLQAMDNGPDDITGNQLTKLNWSRRLLIQYVNEAHRRQKTNDFANCSRPFIKEAIKKYRELNSLTNDDV